jgi:predicted nucleotidyltransferase
VSNFVTQSDRIQKIVNTIVNIAQPNQVILFGSRAKGTAREGSDYDFMVVIQDIENERDVSRRIYRALLDNKTSAAVDVVIVDTETLARRKDNPFYIYSQVLREGKIYYDLERV